MVYNSKDGFHIGTLLSCTLMSVNWSLFSAMIVPNMPFLVRMYYPDVSLFFVYDAQISPEKVGSLVGVLTAFYFVGQIPGSLFWGRLGDTIGRKTSIVITLLGDDSVKNLWIVSALCLVLFGFSTNFTLSVWIRFLHGLLDGAIPLGKTILSEISNEKNIAFGTSQFFVGTSIGGSRLF